MNLIFFVPLIRRNDWLKKNAALSLFDVENAGDFSQATQAVIYKKYVNLRQKKSTDIKIGTLVTNKNGNIPSKENIYIRSYPNSILVRLNPSI